MATRFYLLSAASGCAWAVVAWFLGRGAMASILWGGLFASPLIGLVIGAIHRRVGARSRTVRVFLALGTLYVAAALFGLGVGLFDLTRDLHGRDSLAVVVQAILGTLWGVTFTGFVVFLWPLAILNHWLLDRWGGSSSDHPAPIRGPACPIRSSS